MIRLIALTLLATQATLCLCLAQSVRGRVIDQSSTDMVNARVTLFNSDTTFFVEGRAGSDGRFNVDINRTGSFRLGVSAIGYAYWEQEIILEPQVEIFTEIVLEPEEEKGIWRDVGNPGEKLGGTNSASLLPNGRILYCHDTRDPVIFDPVTSQIVRAAESQRLQGCHAVALLPNGRLLFVGGTDREEYGPGTRQVKSYDYLTDTWTVLPEILDYRWYPTMTSLADGRMLVAGGGGLDNPQRVSTAELLDPTTMRSAATGSIEIGNEVSPVALLFDGRVLMTHRPPQLYDPKSGRWERATDFNNGPRTPNGDHSDHEITVMPDGRVVAIGYKPFGAVSDSSFVEIYSPSTNSWSVGAYFAPLRSRASIVTLPTDEIMVIGGEKEVASDPTPTNRWNNMALTDLFDPASDTWRRLADLNIAREYHTTPLLIPDGRVVTVGGEGAPGNTPTQSTIEIFSPPYLFRGVRPRISSLSTTSVEPGAVVTLSYDRTQRPTTVKLIGCSANTHFMESGPNRSLTLDFVAENGMATVTIPNDPRRVPPGYYQLFIMTDDIPSIGRILLIGSATTGIRNHPGEDVPSASIKEIGSEDGIGRRSVRFLLPYPADYTLEVLDAVGRHINDIDRGKSAVGVHAVEWDTAGLPSGAYYYRLRWSDEFIIHPFRLVR